MLQPAFRLRDGVMRTISEINEVEKRVASLVAALAVRHDVRTRFRSSDALLDGGMTSVAMVELMLSVESHFDLIVPDVDLTPANFQSIASLTGLVSRLQGPSIDRGVGPGAAAEAL